MKYITCPGCGRQNIPETEDTCPQCGFSLYVPQYPGAAANEPAQSESDMSGTTQNRTGFPQPTMSYPNNQNDPSKRNHNGLPKQQPHSKREAINAWDAIGIIAGIVVMIIGIVNITSVGDKRFGADFYTDIYEVVAICARGIFALFTLSGLGMIIYHSKSIVSRK